MTESHTVQLSYSNSPQGLLQEYLSVYWQLGVFWPVLLSGYEMKDCPAEPHSSDVLTFFFRDHMSQLKAAPALCLSEQPS